jgi:hypothetical protein
MGELPERCAGQMGRRRFIRRSSQLAVGTMAVLAGGGGLRMLTSPPARVNAQSAADDLSPGAGGPSAPLVKGITLSGLQMKASGGTSKTQCEVEREIAASQKNFGATHIRLQIQQQAFISNGSEYNPVYAETVYATINYALGLGLNVIINCQTEQAGTARTDNYPNNATKQFWYYMLTSQGGNYGGNPNVICDLFNEPQCGPGTAGWDLWHDAYNGLITYIRCELGIVGNQLWADANDYASSFHNCPGLTDPADNLVYSFHHPKSGKDGDTAGWYTDFGKWAATHPVVNGEFAQNRTIFNWGSPSAIQQYLNYCAGKGIGHTLWTVYGDNYFSDSNFLPCGWWGNMIYNFWNPGDGWATYCFQSLDGWSQNYIMSTGEQLPWENGLYQGWSVEENSMLAGVAGFSAFTPEMQTGTLYRMHVSFQCVYADNAKVTAIVGVHGASSAPSTWSGVAPLATNIVQDEQLASGNWCNVDIPPDYLGSFAAGYYTGIVFGPGPSSDSIYEGHMSLSPEVVIEVHA